MPLKNFFSEISDAGKKIKKGVKDTANSAIEKGKEIFFEDVQPAAKYITDNVTKPILNIPKDYVKEGVIPTLNLIHEKVNKPILNLRQKVVESIDKSTQEEAQRRVALGQAKDIETAKQRIQIENMVFGLNSAPENVGKPILKKGIDAAKPIIQDAAEGVIGKAKEVVGNLRLDKFDIPEEGKNIIREVIEGAEGFIEQRRGIMPFAETERLAKELIPQTKLRKGTALNAEELQSLGDTIATMQNKVTSFAEKIKDPAGDSLLNRAQLLAAKEELSAALQSYAGATAEAGRSLSILRNLRKAIGSGDTDLLRRAVKLSEGEVGVDEIAKKLVEFGEDNLGKIRFVQGLAKPGASQKIQELWINSILSNPKTQAVNITSNLLRGMFEVPIKTTQALIELPKKNKEVFLGEVPHQVVGAIEGMWDGVRKGLYVMRHGLSPEDVSKLDMGYAPAIKGKLGEVIRVPTKMLAAADEFFKTVAGTAELRALAYRQAKKDGLKGQELIEKMHDYIANPTKEILDEVDLRKLEATFQQPLGKMSQAVMDFRNKVPGFKYVVPFLKTPTNIFKDAVKTSPLGFANVARKVATGGYKGMPKSQMTRELSQATLGSIMAIPVVFAALEGKITGSPPKSSVDRKNFYDVEGKQPFSVKIGDKWVSYARLEPFNTILGSVVDFTNLKDESERELKASDISYIIGKNLQNKTFLQGLANLMDALSDPERYGESFIANLGAGMVPFSGTLRFTSQLMDPTVRKPEGMAETIKAGIPGLSDEVNPLRNLFGEPVQRTKSQIMSPVAVTSAEQTPLGKKLSEASIKLNLPSEDIQGVKLSPKEYDVYSKTVLKVRARVLENLTQTPGWDKMNAVQKEKAVEKVTREVGDKVRDAMFPVRLKTNDIVKELRARGMSEFQAQKKAEQIIKKVEEKLKQTQ